MANTPAIRSKQAARAMPKGSRSLIYAESCFADTGHGNIAKARQIPIPLRGFCRVFPVKVWKVFANVGY